ncbi:MAG: flavodoxin family protein [Klebsiella quasipneumoniae]|nr:flavodoxin family protein [Klebsiella quasipneumoniae]
MKILGISGGTPNGNNDAMCKQALMGAESMGAQVQFINLNQLHIAHCTGCKACVMGLFSGKGSLCVLKDDFEWLLDQMYDSDGIIWSVPIFEKGATGLFHTITDRFGPRMDRGNLTIAAKISAERGGKAIDPRFLQDKLVSYMGVGGSDWTTRVQCDFGIQALTPMWKIIDNRVFPWSLDIMMNDKALAEAKQVGINMEQAAGRPSKAAYQGEAGICGHCHSRNFYLQEDGKGICCLCGIEGRIEVADGKYRFIFPEEQLAHAHDTLSGKFIHGDDIQKNEGKARAAMSTDEAKRRRQTYRDYIQSSKPGKGA